MNEPGSMPYVYDVSARELVKAMAQHFPYGTTSGKLKEQFGKDTGLKKQTYYNALEVAKAKQWIVGGGGKKGQRYSLNPNGCWQEVMRSISISKTEQVGPISNQSTGLIPERHWTDGHLAIMSGALQHIDQKKR
jgi:hypothetical protein